MRTILITEDQLDSIVNKDEEMSDDESKIYCDKSELTDDDIKHYQDLVKSANIDNVKILEDDEDGNILSYVININGASIPKCLIMFEAQIPNENTDFYRRGLVQLHIILDTSLQRLGLGTKLYTVYLYKIGNIYSGAGYRHNDRDIPKIYDKLSKNKDFIVWSDTNDICIGMDGKADRKDYFALYKNRLDKFV